MIMACGKLEDSILKLNPLAPVSNSMGNINTNGLEAKPTIISPGSYYGVAIDEGDTKDTVIREFQYLSDSSFIIKESRFTSGLLINGVFQSTTGIYKEENGVYQHSVKSDSCNNLDPFKLTFSGDKSSTIKTTYKLKTLSLHNLSKYPPPVHLLGQIGKAIEDVSCKTSP